MKRLFLLSFSIVLFMVNGFGQIPEDEREITASSTLPPSSTSSFTPDHLMDGTLASWSEGADGPGVGEYIEIFLKYRDYLDFIAIKNGYGNPKYWEANNRVRKLRITAESGAFREITLEDTPEMRVYGTIEIIDDPFGDLQEGEPMYGRHFTLEILSVYRGSRWDDACITEIAFNEWFTENFRLEKPYVFKNIFRVFLDGIIGPAGELFIETDYEGLEAIDVSDGYLRREIVSGDGTSGFHEYRLFRDDKHRRYIMFSSTSLKYMGIVQEEHPEHQEAARKTPEWRQMEELTHSFDFMADGADLFLTFEEEMLEDLFDAFPTSKVRELTGRDVGPDEVWLRCGDAPEVLEAIYPATLETDPQVHLYYTWNGSRFILSGYSPLLP